jgi:hypothetical protein
LDLQVLVAQLQIHEQLVVILEQQVQVQQVLEQLVQLVQVLVLVQLVLVQLVQEQQLVVSPLELVEHPCLPKNFGAQKKLVQKNLMQGKNLAYLF